MTPDSSKPLTKAAIHVAAAGLGAAVAGPLGFALGAVIGDALGEPAAQLIGTYTEKFGEEAAKKLLDTGVDSLVERLKKSAPDLESAYRQALRLSLSKLHTQTEPEFNDWFLNWELCLDASVSLNLEEIQPNRLTTSRLDDVFRSTMERLDAQGSSIQQRSLSLNLTCRSLPNTLLDKLRHRLPDQFKENFKSIVAKPEYEQAWKQVEQLFQETAHNLLISI